MKKIYVIIICFYSIVNFSQTITTTKAIPKEINIEALKSLGDSIKIIKDLNFDNKALLINKKDTVQISLLSLKYDFRNSIKDCLKFENKNQTITFFNGAFEITRINSENLSFFMFRYTTLELKRFNFMGTIEKLKNIDNQINKIFEN